MSNPGYPDAHPTAPGGMSEKALCAELVQEHDYDATAARKLSWPEKIQFVIEGRLNLDEVAEVNRQWAALSDDTVCEACGRATDEKDSHGTLMCDQCQVVEEDYATLLAEFEDAADQRGAAEREAAASAPAPLFIGMPDTADYRFDNHAGAGPSGAERWMNCTKSLSMSRAFLETLSRGQQAEFARSGDAARQGTTAHAAAETEANLMLGRIDQEEADYALLELAIIPETQGEAYDDEMGEYIVEYVDLIKSYANERTADHVLIEARVEATIPLAGLHEGDYHVIPGSGDMVVLPVAPGTGVRDEDSTLVVGDLKYGEGINVEVDENPQVRIYALAALELLADPETGAIPEWVEDVVYHIIQPRLGGIKTWTESVDDLLDWRDSVLSPALTYALYPEEGATFAPSDKACEWCPARGMCPALADARVDAAADLFDVIVESEAVGLSFANPVGLSDERLGALLTQVAGLKAIYDDLKDEAQRRLHRGGHVPGYQLVSYTPPRGWAEAAPEALNETAALWKDPTLVSPTQALKILKNDEAALALVEPLIVAPDKRPVIAREGDRRKTWTGTPPEQMFPDLPDETGDDE